MSTIPISTIISVTPSVLSAGGTGLDMCGMVLTQNVLVTSSTIVSFSTLADVSTLFGPTSDETKIATVYFSGFTTGTKTPGVLKFFGTGVSPTLATSMATLISLDSDWTTLLTTWVASTNDMEALATWVSASSGGYVYACGDADATAGTTDPTSFTGMGHYLVTSNKAGVALCRSNLEAAFVAGMIASTDYDRAGGRISLAFKSNTNLVPSVTTSSVASHLIANGYNYFGAYATAATPFNIFYNGQISGPSKWIDSYVGAIWLDNALQLDLAELFTSINSLPYAKPGYTAIKTACMGTIQQGILNGVITPGVPLSGSQIATVNAQAGLAIDNQLSVQGYYFQVLPATANARATRSTPPCTLWYMDGGSINQLNLASIDVQ